MRNNLIILFLSISVTAGATDSLLLHLPVQARFITTDSRMHIYYLNDKNEVVQYNFADSTQITYSNKILGKPSLIDASNPMKILVYYPDYFSIVLLDNTLSQLSILTLNHLSGKTSLQPSAVCKETTSDLIWMYDELSRRLIRFDESGTVIAESETFDHLFDFIPDRPQLVSIDQKIAMIDAIGGLNIFDMYGNFEFHLNFTIDHPAQYNNSYLITTDGYNVMASGIYSGDQNHIKTFNTPIRQCNINGGYLFVLSASGIDVYEGNY